MSQDPPPVMCAKELGNGPIPTQGKDISVAGFIGLAAKGPVGGAPQLVMNAADYRRKFGGSLSADQFGDHRFLPLAVEHFFINGGTKAFVSRVAPPDAKRAEAQHGAPLRLTAASVGAWGNNLQATLTPASKASSLILELIAPTRVRVKSGVGFYAGDAVVLVDRERRIYNKIVEAQGDTLELAEALGDSMADAEIALSKCLYTCEFSLDIRHGDIFEIYDKLSLNRNSPHYVGEKLAKSDLVTADVGETLQGIAPPFAVIAGVGKAEEEAVTITFAGGFDGTGRSVTPDLFIGKDNGPGKRTGIQAFKDNSSCGIMAVPGVTDPKVQKALVAHCEDMASRFAVLDMPRERASADEVIAHRELFDTQCAAFYHPWLCVFDPSENKEAVMPPSGSVAGIYARSDAERGVHKAPANEVVRSCTGLSVLYNKGEQDILNPRGVNLIRAFPGQGIRVWGARTAGSSGPWKYVNVRRLFIYVEDSIMANTNWVVFEPNDATLWARVQRTIEVFLIGLWRGGMLVGASPEEAFYVQVGRTTMSQDDIDNCRLICVIGIAPVKPAEFVVFRLSQKTAGE